MSKNMRWVLYDSFSKAQSQPVTTEEAQMAIFKMRSRDMERFYLWTQGWAEWQSLSIYLVTDQKYFVSSFTIANEDTLKAKIRDVLEVTPVNNKKLHDEITASFSSIHLEETNSSAKDAFSEKQFDGEDISWSNLEKPKIDFSKLKNNREKDRRDTRHELKIEILLISSKGKTFRSKSKNISLSGSLLEDNIPFDYYGTTFDIVVVNQHAADARSGRISLRGKTVGDGLTQRLQYIEVSEAKKTELQNFLQSYIDLQKNYSKKSA